MVNRIGGWNPTVFYSPEDGGGIAGGQQGGNDGAAGDNPNGGGQSGAASSGQPGAQGASQGGNQGGQPQGGQPQGSQFTYKEDRSDWVPRHRLNEQATKFERELANLKKEMASNSDLGNRLRAALDPNGGANAQEQAQIEETRQALIKVFPELAHLGDLKNATINHQRSEEQRWTRHAQTMLTDLKADGAKAFGVDKLSDKQSKTLERIYRAEAQECAAARQRAFQSQDPNYDFDNDFISRHERGDKSLIAEVVKTFVDEFYTPGMRAGSADATRRFGRPVPRGERTRTLPVSGQPQVDLTTEDGFKKALLNARNGGGQ